jgi:hypothetical protein
MVLNHNAGQSDKLRISSETCVQRAQAGRFVDAMPFCSTAIRYAESATAGEAPDIALSAAAARSNRAVVSWLLGHDERAAADLAVAAAQSPGAGFVIKNIAAMGIEPPATSLAGGAND